MAVAGLSGQLFGQPENSAKYEPSRIFGNRGKVSLEKRGVGGEFHGTGVDLGGWSLHTGLEYQLRDAPMSRRVRPRAGLATRTVPGQKFLS